jgi:type I restriction enzyme S subunit
VSEVRHDDAECDDPRNGDADTPFPTLEVVNPLSAGRPGKQALPGWRWFRLTDLARLETGHTPSRSHPEWWGGPIPWIPLADIRELDGKVAQDTLETTNE